MDFSVTDKTLGSSVPIWYPASGYSYDGDGILGGVGSYGDYRSVSPNGKYAYGLGFRYNGGVYPAISSDRALGQSVRCIKE